MEGKEEDGEEKGGLEREYRVLAYEERKKREEEISNQALDLVGKATELVKIKEYDEALEIYDKAIELLKEVNWIEQIETIKKSINKIEIDRLHYKQSLDNQQALAERDRILREEREAELIERVRKKKKQEELEKAKKMEEVERDKSFKEKLSNMVEEADKMERVYESEIKKGNFDLEPPYENLIGIYEEMQKMLIENAWNDQAKITTRQIQVYKNKLEQDKRLRAVELEKIRKHQEYLDSLKFTKKKVDMSEYERKKKEEEDFQNQVYNIIDEADRATREYEREIRKKNFDISCPFPKIIEKYEKLKQMLTEKGWKGQLDLANNQILFYKGKLEKDNKLRALEAQKH